jgi:hypothetical protein
MKLHLLLLASLCNLSSGFMVELRGPRTAEECTGDEYAGFQHCAMLGAEADPNLSVLSEIEEEALVNRGVDSRRQLSYSGCTDGAPTGTFCYSASCATSGRRLLEEGVDSTPNVRRVMVEDNIAIFENGAYMGGGDARDIAEDVIACLEDVLTKHPCLGTINTMSLIVTVTL